MNRLAEIVLKALLLGIVLLIAGPVTNLMPARADKVGGDARQLFDLLNGARAKAGLPPLAWDARLATAAQRHTQAMADRQRLAHQLPGEPELERRLAAVPLDSSGENVASGPDIPSIHNGFMHSPPHRANILNPSFDAVGIGIARRGADLWATQDFAQRMPEISRQTAADQVARAFNEARAQAGQPMLKRLPSRRIEQVSCSMGEEGRPDADAVLRLLGARNALAYSTTDPSRLPAKTADAVHARDVDSYSVGACFVRSSTYPSGIYWVALATLRSAQ